MASDILKPGQRVPAGGLYAVVDRRGRLTGGTRRIAPGDRLPPTPRAGQRYVLLGFRRPGESALEAHRAVYEACAERRLTGALGG